MLIETADNKAKCSIIDNRQRTIYKTLYILFEERGMNEIKMRRLNGTVVTIWFDNRGWTIVEELNEKAMVYARKHYGKGE